VRTEVGKAVVGQDPVVTGLLIALLCQGHVLLEGVPGVAKTLLVRALAASLRLQSKRLQFTPDLMPGDVTGSLIYDARTARFEFRDGPIFTNLLLADEINRTPPKTQAALLEAMEERQVSVERSVWPLPADFLVVATQNPREFEGTYPLPESQLDRFMLRIDMDYPSAAVEAQILTRYGGVTLTAQSVLEEIRALERAQLSAARADLERIHIAEALTGYVLELARASRRHPRLTLGLSTRGALALLKAARISAGLRGADFVTPDDVKESAVLVMAHRLVLTPEAALEGASDAEVVRSLLAETPVPR
jgi:MoxR-like ATPase